MGKMIGFALNHMTCPNLSLDRFLAVARDLGCVGIELRTDIDPAFFERNPPREIARKAREAGLRVLALAELYGFNDLTPARYDEACRLMDLAAACEAEAVVLIPLNEGCVPERAQRLDGLSRALEILAPELSARQLRGFVEPLGFASSSLRLKADVVDVIEALSLAGSVKLIHDTFHHHLSGEQALFGHHTGLVHISGTQGGRRDPATLKDGDRVLVGADDQLENIEQIKALQRAGYAGPLSFEAFAPEVHNLRDPADELSRSLDFIAQQSAAEAA